MENLSQRPSEVLPKVLIVDDEKIALLNLEHVMKKEGYNVRATQSPLHALKMLEDECFDVVLTDLKMEKVDGMQILRRCKELYPDTEIIVITAYATLDSAVESIKHGAYYYIAKPYRLDEVRKVVKEAIEKVMLKQENKQLKEQLESFTGKVKIITQNADMQRLLKLAEQVAQTDCSVVILGESGTGKELFARYIHATSMRSDKPFVAINCGTFSDELLTNELFGHEKGSFTGATEPKKGIIEIASGGSVFLDEITELIPANQVKLLRVIQEKEMYRIGATKPIPVDVRYIAATNRDMTESVNEGRFRKDLFFRLNVVTLYLPSLSQRKDDIPLLSYYFLKKYSVAMKKHVLQISDEVLDILGQYDFPGNVRELENIIERGVALARGNMITISDLHDDLKSLKIKTFRKKDGRFPTLEEQEAAYIKVVLASVNWNKTHASSVLGIDRVSLWRKLKKYGLLVD